VYLTCTLHLGNEEGIAAAHWIPAARASCAVIAANCSTSFASPTAPKAIGQGKEGTSLSLVATPRSKSAATSKGSIESRWNWLATLAALGGEGLIRPVLSLCKPKRSEPTWYFSIWSLRSLYSGPSDSS